MLSNSHLIFEEEIKQNIVERFERFKSFQSLMLNVLSDFHRVCEKNGIQYFLAYGSLLGAIRDNGQIPWDYDIDTWVHFEDKEKLFKALENDLCKDYYFVCHYYHNSAYHRMLRISPKGYNSEVLHVDVFWLSGASDNPVVNKKQLKNMERIRRISFYKYCDYKFMGNLNSRLIQILTRFKIIMSRMIPDVVLDKIYNKYVSRSSTSSKMVNDGDSLYADSEWFKKNKCIEIGNGMKLSVPYEYENLLKLLYGNYQDYMPIENRMTEFCNALLRIETLGK